MLSSLMTGRSIDCYTSRPLTGPPAGPSHKAAALTEYEHYHKDNSQNLTHTEVPEMLSCVSKHT